MKFKMGELRRDLGDMMGFDLIVTNGSIVRFQFLCYSCLNMLLK
jgi:hypothetical protein